MKTSDVKATLQLTGMDSGSAVAIRERWSRAGGLELIARTLGLAELGGAWVVRLHSQIKATGHTPQISYRGYDAQQGVELRTRPTSNDTCLKLHLRRMGMVTTEADANAISDAIDGPAEGNADNGQELSAAISHKASNGELPEVAKILLDAASPPKGMSVAETLKIVEQIKDVQRQIADTEADLEKLRAKKATLVAAVANNTKPLYDAIELIEALSGKVGGS